MTKAGGALLKQRYTVEQLIDEPTTTAEWLERKGKGTEKTWRLVNTLEQVGGVAYLRGKDILPIHYEAAKRFKAAYEAKLGHGLGAVDTTKEPVDSSLNVDWFSAGMANVIDRNRKVHEARAIWGFQLLVAVVIGCNHIADLIEPKITATNERKRAIKKKRAELLAVLEKVGKLWGLSG